MTKSGFSSRIVRFGAFEVDLANLELRKQGLRLHLQEQPFQVLAALLERPGEVVAREDLIQRLWPDGTVVDFDRGLNAAVTRLRQALSDSAETPRYVETAARRGYRFIAPVEAAEAERSLDMPAPPARAKQRSWLWAAVGLIVVVAIPTAWWSLNHRRVPSSEKPLRAIPLTSEPGFEQNPSFSPDGNQVAFAWDKGDGATHIYIKLVGPGDFVQLTSGRSAEFGPAWSPDGRQIAFLRQLNESTVGVFVIPALGGVERKVAEYPRPNDLRILIRRLDWTRDSRHLIASGPEHVDGGEGLFVISLETGEKKWLTKPSGDSLSGDREPAVAPDGRMVAFVRGVPTASEAIYLLPLSGDLRPAGEPRQLASAGRARSPAWTPDGRDIVFTRGDPRQVLSSRLWRISVNTGMPPRDLPALGTNISVPAVSRTGRLAYSRVTIDSNIWRQELPGRAGTIPLPVILIASTAIDMNAQYSPDGTRIAFASSRSGSTEIWVCNSEGAHCIQITHLNGTFITGTPRWSPDSKWIAFDSAATGKYNVYVVEASGGPLRRATDDSSNSAIPSWSQDGRYIYFQSLTAGASEIWKIPSTGGTSRQVTRNGGMVAFESPDGKALYYTKAAESDARLWRSALDGSGETAVLDSVAHRSFVIASDRIYYMREEPGGATAIRRFLLATGEDSRIASISKPTSLGLSLSPDGKHLIYTQVDAQGSDLMLVEEFR